MKISIFGIGYVGAVTAGCLSKRGHTIIGVDVNPQKIEVFNQGLAPIVEPGLDELLASAKARGILSATVSCDDAIAGSDVSIICVGTPSALSGALDLGFVRGVIQQIAESLRKQRKPHSLIIRSTMLPGSTAQLVNDLLAELELSGGLRVFYYPEFLREGTAVADFERPSLEVLGTRDGAKPSKELTLELFGENAQVVNWSTAEMVKYACNAFHATKIVFANEMGRIGKELGIDAQAVMALLCRDTKLNLSPYYLRPGNPFGGSCLPKDVRALTHHGRQHGLNLPMIESLLSSNERHLQSLLALITQSGQSEIVILGLSFKSNTDDLRESAMVEVAQIVLGRGYRLRIYDPALNLAALVGSNKRLIDMRMPHLASLLHQDLKTALGERGLLIAAQKCASIDQLAQVLTPQHHILDVNGWPELRSLPAKYGLLLVNDSAVTKHAVLIIVENLPVPLDRRVWQESCALRDAGYEVVVICPKMRGYTQAEEKLDGIQIYRHWISEEAGGFVGFFREYASALWGEMRLAWKAWRRHRFKVIHLCNPPDLLFLVAFPFKLFGVKVIYDVHDVWPEMFEAKFGKRGLFYWIIRLAERLTYATSNVVLATNQSVREVAIQRGRKAADKVFIVRTAPKIPSVTGPVDLSLKGGRKYLAGYVGVMGDADGVNYLLDAANHVVHKVGRKDIQFLLMGTGPEYERLLKQRARLQLEEYVDMPGRVTNEFLFTALRTIDVGVSCDPINAYNQHCTMNKVLEYMAFGKPQVMFDLREGRESANEAAWYVGENSAEQLGAAVVRLLDDPKAREAMGKIGAERIASILNWEKSVEQLLRAYERNLRD